MEAGIYTKDGLKSVELCTDKRTGLWYRPGSSDKLMLRECANDYLTVSCAGRTVFDLGANIGGFMLKAAKDGADHIVAFEPEPANLAVLRENIKLIQTWHPSVKITLVAAAVAPTDGELTFVINPGENSACSGSITAKPRANRISITVPTVSFQRMLEEHRPSMIKMDIEGGEYQLLGTGIPHYVTDLAIELHGFSKQNNVSMESTFADLSSTWNTIAHDQKIVFNRPVIRVAHFRR